MPTYTLPLLCINGRIDSYCVDDESQAGLSPLDRGLAYGDGVFETILLVDGLAPLLSFHHQRLLKGLSHLKIQLDSERLVNDVNKVLAIAKSFDDKRLILKLTITRGVGGRGYQIDPDAKATLMLQLFACSTDLTKHNGVSVHVCRETLSPISWAGLKTLNQLPYVLAASERLNTNFDEGLLLANNGELVEASARNVFIVKDDKILTPALNKFGVAGVQRQFIIESLAQQLGLHIVETTLKLESLFAADEVFLANSITGLWPVTHCHYKEHNYSWDVGMVTRSLQAMCHNVFFDE
ncbi:MAG: 4-amino-4-deoxychorismate lyase [Pseudohongiellaceae bacterium]|jgi:4-amino-4-deoxychorismate lyase